jgi:hypothetical protein
MSRSTASGVDFERLLAESFRHAHWRVRRHPRLGDLHPDFFVDAIGKTYIVKLKRSSEGRGDRLIPLLAQAILHVQAIARQAAGKAPDRLFGEITDAIRSASIAAVGRGLTPESVRETYRFGLQHLFT